MVSCSVGVCGRFSDPEMMHIPAHSPMRRVSICLELKLGPAVVIVDILGKQGFFPLTLSDSVDLTDDVT